MSTEPSVHDYWELQIGRARGPSAPEILARVVAHHENLPWASVPSLVNALEFSASLARLPVAPTPEQDRELGECSERLRRVFERCESPLEELFVAYLARTQLEEWRWGIPTREEPAFLGALVGVGWVYQQPTLGGLRPDFALCSLDQKLRIAVELDGHDFHERTKAQAQRDKARDRRLVSSGWSVVRFTGSEIWKDPAGCVAEVIGLLQREAVA